MKEEPLVSVIMIAYNHEALIDEAIRSVMLQKTDFPVELIIADDASTDGTAKKAEKWRQKYPERIKLIRRTENKGLQENFLDAYSHARGKYVAICESDDHWCSSKKLKREVDFLEKNPGYSVCFHRVVNHYADTHTKSLSNPHQKKHLTLEDLAKGNVITNLSVMYRRIEREELPEWLREIKLIDYAMHSLHAERGDIGYINRLMAVYRRHSRGIWSGDEKKALILAMDVRERLMAHFHGKRDEAVKNYLKAYVDIGVALGARAESEGERAETIKRVIHECKRYGDETTETELSERIVRMKAETGKRKRGLLRLTLKKARGVISLLIPVPRIRRF